MTRFFNTQSLLNLFVCGSLSLVSVSLFAATLQVSDNLIVSEIDDKTIEHGFIGKTALFSLNQGEHALIVRYKDVFEDLAFAEERVIESKEFIVKFTITTEEHLKLTTININNLAAAESFYTSPKLILQDEGSKQLVIELAEVSDYKLAKQVELAVNNFTSQQAIKNEVNPLLSATTEAKAISINSTIMSPSNNALIQINSLVMLKYWWQNASDHEKSQFKALIDTKNQITN